MAIRFLASLAAAAVVIHAAAMVLLHWLVPSVNPRTDMVGAYLNSDYAWLSRVTFFALACAFASLGLGLILRHTQGTTFTIAVVLAAIAVVGFLGVAAVPAAASLFARPTQPAAIVAILLLSLVLRQEAEWQAVGFYLLGISAMLIAMFLATIVFGVLMSAGFGGVANRVVLVLIYSWVLLVARGLLTPPEAL